MLTDTSTSDVVARAIVVEQAAATGSGQSYELYEKRLHAGYRRMLSEVPADCRVSVEAILVHRGYQPDFVPYESEPGQCSLTGIDQDCCPCGRHL